MIIVMVIAAGLYVLFMWPSWSDPNRDLYKAWADFGVDCLPNGHANLSQHIHQKLTIVVDGQSVELPANIGIARNCLAEVHTHDSTGTIHVESVLAVKNFSLGQFFQVWGQPFEREGYNLEMTMSGAKSRELDKLVLKDGQVIELKYSKK